MLFKVKRYRLWTQANTNTDTKLNTYKDAVQGPEI